MKKILCFLFLFFVGGLVLAGLTRNWWLKKVTQMAVTRITGFKTRIKSFKIDFPGIVHIEGLEIRNPAGFNEKVFADIPEIYISVVLSELLKTKRIHLPEVRLNIQQIHLEKNSQGVSNVELLSSVAGPPPQKSAEQTAPGKKEDLAFLLDRLELTMRDVSFQDRSGIIGKVPVNKLAVDLNVQKQIFTNIQSPQTLVNLILVKIVQGTTFGRLLNLHPEKLLGENLSAALSAGGELVGKNVALITDQAGNIAGQATDLVKQSGISQKAETLVGSSFAGAKNTLGATSAAGRQKISGLFGKLKSLAPSEEKPA